MPNFPLICEGGWCWTAGYPQISKFSQICGYCMAAHCDTPCTDQGEVWQGRAIDAGLRAKFRRVRWSDVAMWQTGNGIPKVQDFGCIVQLSCRFCKDSALLTVSSRRVIIRPIPTNFWLVNYLLSFKQMDGSQHFWTTVCKTVCPMLSDRCSVCLTWL